MKFLVSRYRQSADLSVISNAAGFDAPYVVYGSGKLLSSGPKNKEAGHGAMSNDSIAPRFGIVGT
jgi:hypothetical protein